MNARPLTLETVRDIAHRPIKAEIHGLLTETIVQNYHTRIVDADSRRPGIETRRRGAGKLRWLSLPGPDWVGEQVMFSNMPAGMVKRVEEVVGLEGSHDPKLVNRFRASAKMLRSRYPDTTWTTINGTDREVLVPARSRKREKFDPRTGYDFAWFDFCCPLTDAMLCSVSLIGQAAPMFERAWRQQRPGLLYITLQAGMDHRTALSTLDWLNSNQTVGSKPDLYRHRASGLTALLNRNSQPMGYTCIPTQWVFYREKLDERIGARMYLLGYEVWKGDYEYEAEYSRLIEKRYHT